MTMQYVLKPQTIVISKEQLNKGFVSLSDLFATEKSHSECVEISPKVEMTMQYVRKWQVDHSVKSFFWNTKRTKKTLSTQSIEKNCCLSKIFGPLWFVVDFVTLFDL